VTVGGNDALRAERQRSCLQIAQDTAVVLTLGRARNQGDGLLYIDKPLAMNSSPVLYDTSKRFEQVFLSHEVCDCIYIALVVFQERRITV